jgi:hypothetical protein
MKVALLSETFDTEGRPLRRIVDEPKAEVGKAPLDGKDRWEWTASLSKVALEDAAQNGADGNAPRVMLYVEEVEHFRPAEYPNEPLSPSQALVPDPTAETGPRYAQKLSLEPMLGLKGPQTKPKGLI